MLRKLRAIYVFGAGGSEAQAGPKGQEDAELSPGSIVWVIPVETHVVCTVSPVTVCVYVGGGGHRHPGLQRVQQVLNWA